MADGSRKAIEKIVARETQTSSPPDYDPEGPAKNCRVLHVYRNAPARILHVRVAGQVIRTTFNHPFYVRGKGWTAAEKLQAGDRLRTHEGNWARVEGTEDSGQVEPVFNLHVEASQTYFVAAGEDGPAVLVHNQSVSAPPRRPRRRRSRAPQPGRPSPPQRLPAPGPPRSPDRRGPRRRRQAHRAAPRSRGGNRGAGGGGRGRRGHRGVDVSRWTPAAREPRGRGPERRYRQRRADLSAGPAALQRVPRVHHVIRSGRVKHVALAAVDGRPCRVGSGERRQGRRGDRSHRLTGGSGPDRRTGGRRRWAGARRRRRGRPAGRRAGRQADSPTPRSSRIISIATVGTSARRRRQSTSNRRTAS